MAEKTTRKTRRRTTKADQKLLDELNHRFRVSQSATAKWRSHMIRAHKYYESSQRPADIGSDDDTLYVSLNLTRNRTDTKIGILAQNKPRIELVGRGIEDVDSAVGFQDLMEYSCDRDDIDAKTEDAIADQVKTGWSVWEEEWNPDLEHLTKHGWADGELELSVGDIARYYPDPSNRSASMTGKHGIDWYIVESFPCIDDLKLIYPEFKRRFEALQKEPADAPTEGRAYDADYESGTSDEETDSETSRAQRFSEPTARQLTMWYYKAESIEKVLKTDDEGHIEPAVVMEDDGSQRPMNPDDIPEEPEDGITYEVVHRIERKVWTRTAVGDILLYDRQSPYRHNKLPATFFCAIRHHDEPIPYGEIHRLFDAQDLYNKINSVMLDNVIRTNNQGIIYEEGAFGRKTEEEVAQKLGTPGFALMVKQGALGGGTIKPWQTGTVPDGFYRLQNDIRVVFDELSGLYQTQRGGMPYDTSGKAIIALQQAGDTALVGLQRNIEQALTEWGRKRLSNIQQFYTYERMWRISDVMQDQSYHILTELKGNEDKGEPTLHMFKLEEGNPGEPKEPVLLAKDFGAGEYDVRIRVKSGHDRSPEEKRETATALFDRKIVDREYVAKEFEVEGWREMFERMDEKDQILQLGKAVAEAGLDPQAIVQIQGLLQDEDMGPLMQKIIGDPALLLMAARESPALMGTQAA